MPLRPDKLLRLAYHPNLLEAVATQTHHLQRGNVPTLNPTHAGAQCSNLPRSMPACFARPMVRAWHA
eukprot:10337812-Alexandrium_andersonii.AAC.1